MAEKAKEFHNINIKIPINLWDEIEKQRLEIKQARPDRKFTIASLVVDILKKGLNFGRFAKKHTE